MAGYKPGRKSYLILGLIFILTIGTVIYIVRDRTNKIVTELTLNLVETANRSFISYLSELKGKVTGRAEVISNNDDFINGIVERDHETLKRILFSFSLGIDFASICDSNGIVLARSHSDLIGDDISGYMAVSAVLRTGFASNSIELVESNGRRLSIYASVPVYNHGVMIGIVNCNYDLTRNVYVDEFKERSGCEASIFLNNEQISTTITDKFGNRITGAYAPAFIAETVMGKKKDYIVNMDLYGHMFGSCYSPLLRNGEAIGMFFTGVDLHSTFENRRAMNMWVMLASVLGMAASIIFMAVSSIVTQKYARLAEKQLQQQILMAGISQDFLSDTNTEKLISDTLQKIGQFMELSELLLYMPSEDGRTITCSNEWTDPMLCLVSRIGNKLQMREHLFSLIGELKTGAMKDSCLHSDDPVVKKSLGPYRVNFKNYIITPIFVRGELLGVIDYLKTGKSREWTDSEISLATHFASTLSGVFERKAMGRQTSLVENSPHMIFYVDPDGTIAYSNPAVTVVTGYTFAELNTGGLALLFDEETIRHIKEEYIPKTIQNGTERHELKMKCKDGQIRILEMTSFEVKDEKIAAIAVDLTEIRTMESELINAKNKADQASRAKSEFLSNMSHEMRTPMNAIIGMTRIAKNAADNEKKEYAINKVEEASTHLLGIINDILDMMKIEANKLELTEAEFDLKNLLQKAVSFVNFRMEEKQQRFSMNLDSNVPLLFSGDDQRLTQVIVNLLSNAAKFTGIDGEINFDISLEGEKDEVCELRFQVADNGIGIPGEQQKKLFRMFEQGESGISRKFGGTGLGLVISKRIVELMGGNISIKSEPGKGSRFIFTVKLKEIAGASLSDQYKDKAGIASGNKNSEPVVAEFAGRKLLLAEDIEINREILLTLLEGTGLAIDTAENGREAFEKFCAAAGSYDLVFMDMQMPEMDGLEATRRIRAFEKEQGSAPENAAESVKPRKRIPIIAMTANVFRDDIENCLAAGMDDHIGKPLDMNAVMEKLHKYISQ